MERKRVFRQNYVPLDKEYKFNCGDIATVVKEGKQNITIKVAEKNYVLPYREFIILTKRDHL